MSDFIPLNELQKFPFMVAQNVKAREEAKQLIERFIRVIPQVDKGYDHPNLEFTTAVRECALMHVRGIKEEVKMYSHASKLYWQDVEQEIEKFEF